MRRISLLILLAVPAAAQKFFVDDPLQQEPRPRHVEQALNRKFSDYYDLFSNQFGAVGQKQPKKMAPLRALAVNTLGEPMDSGWYEKRHYYRRMSREELVRGPGNETPPSTAGKWTIVSAKSEGVTPGFVIIDPAKRRYFIKFDPLTNPEMATAADAIGARLFYALGYFVPQNYIVHFRPEQLEIGPDVRLPDGKGKLRSMTKADIGKLLQRVPVGKDGTYRATASLAVEGKPVGPPRYYGTRSDDPNDIVPHEHRRDLRGLHVFCAWLGHDDSRDINNLDSMVTKDGVQSIRHYLLDFGSILGSATDKPNSPRSGDYFFSWTNSATQLFTLGLKPPYWAFAHYPDLPSVGRFEWKVFNPEKWVPEYPNVAFLNRLPDDEFWAAKQVMAFRDEDIAAIVSTGQLSDPKAAAYIEECLRKRRDKIGKAYFAKVLPLDRFRVADGKLMWEDLSSEMEAGGVADVRVQWMRFDNATEAKTAIAGATSAAVPGQNQYLAAELSSLARPRQTVTVYLRGAEVIGIDRAW